MTLPEGAFGEEVGIDGVFDVDHIDAVLPVPTMRSRPARARASNPRHKMRVADAPDEMWAQRDRAKSAVALAARTSRSGDRFREWVRLGQSW